MLPFIVLTQLTVNIVRSRRRASMSKEQTLRLSISFGVTDLAQHLFSLSKTQNTISSMYSSLAVSM